MLKILTTLAVLLGFTTSAVADYTFVVPQKPGGGTSVWAQIVATEMEKYLDEKIVIKHIRGARDIPGFNQQKCNIFWPGCPLFALKATDTEKC